MTDRLSEIRERVKRGGPYHDAPTDMMDDLEAMEKALALRDKMLEVAEGALMLILTEEVYERGVASDAISTLRSMREA